MFFGIIFWRSVQAHGEEQVDVARAQGAVDEGLVLEDERAPVGRLDDRRGEDRLEEGDGVLAPGEDELHQGVVGMRGVVGALSGRHAGMMAGVERLGYGLSSRSRWGATSRRWGSMRGGW